MISYPLCFSETSITVGADFTKAIQTRNLKKVDQEAEMKRREDAQKRRSKDSLLSFCVCCRYGFI